MKKYQDMLQENSLFSDEKERVAFANDKSKVAEAFVFNFIGILGLLNGAKEKDKIKRYFRSDKRVRLDFIGVRNHDFTLVIKLAHDLGMFRTDTIPAQLTRFAAKLKTGGLDSVNSSIVQAWINDGMKRSEFVASCSPRIRKILTDFMESPEPDLHRTAIELAKYWRVHESVSGDFSQLFRHNKMNPLPAQAEKEIEVEVEKTPPEPAYPTFADGTHLLKMWDLDEFPFRAHANASEQANLSPLIGDGASVVQKDVGQALLHIFRGKGIEILSSDFDRARFSKYAQQVFGGLDVSMAMKATEFFMSSVTRKWKDVTFEILSNATAHKAAFMRITMDNLMKSESRRDFTIATTFMKNLNDSFGITNLYGSDWIDPMIKEVTGLKQLAGVYRTGELLSLHTEAEFRGKIADKFIDMIVAAIPLHNGFEVVRDNFLSSQFGWRVSPTSGLYGDDTTRINKAVGKLKRAVKSCADGSKPENEAKFPALFVDHWGELRHTSAHDSASWSKAITDAFLIDALDHPEVLSMTRYSKRISFYPLIKSLSPDSAIEVVNKIIDLQRDDKFRKVVYATGENNNDIRPEYAAMHPITATLFSQGTLEALSPDEIRARLDWMFETYYPMVGPNETAKIMNGLYQTVATWSSDDGFGGGSRAGRQFMLTCILYNAEKTGVPLSSVRSESAMLNGIFDEVEDADSLRMLEAMESGTVSYLFGKEQIKSIYKRELKRRVKDFYFGLVLDNYDTHPDLVNSVYGKMEPALQMELRKNMVSARVLIHNLQTSVIKTFATIDNRRLKDILSYNGVETEDLLKDLKVRKKKGEKITDYVARARNAVESAENPLGELYVDDSGLDDAGLRALSVDVQSKYRNNRHGDTHFKIRKAFNINLPEDEYNEFSAKMREENVSNEHLVPAFHGTGGIAASMIMRYGFAAIPAGDAAVVGRMLGSGIYVSSVVDKTQQYCQNEGSTITRRYGSRGYLISADFQMGLLDRDYRVAGVGGDSIRSPEWVAKDARGQLKMMYLYEIELISRSAYEKMSSAVGNGNTPTTVAESVIPSYKVFTESIMDEYHEETFRFYDGHIILPNGETPWFEDVEDIQSLLPPGVRYDWSRVGPSIVFENTETTAGYDIKYATSMSDELKSRYRRLMDERRANDPDAPVAEEPPIDAADGINQLM